MKRVTNPNILDAIKKNGPWIKRKCSVSEFNQQKLQELYQEVLYNLYMVKKEFDEDSVLNPDAWVKKITCNITGKHIRNEIVRKSTVSIEENPVTNSTDCNSANLHDLRVAFNYINTNFKDKDREMISLYMIGEEQKNIAQILEMETRSITNRISILKKELNGYLNKGLENE